MIRLRKPESERSWFVSFEKGKEVCKKDYCMKWKQKRKKKVNRTKKTTKSRNDICGKLQD